MADAAPLDDLFHALSHDTRRDMLARLAGAQLSVGELAAPLPVSLAAASKHVQVLERAGLIERTVLGRRHEFRLRRAQLDPAVDWLTVMATSPSPAPAESPAPTPPPDVPAVGKAKPKGGTKKKRAEPKGAKGKSAAKRKGADKHARKGKRKG